jgi:hypothetical protein
MTDVKKDHTLRIRLVPKDSDKIDLETLRRFLNALKPCLDACARVTGAGKLRLKIVNVREDADKHNETSDA